MATITTTSILYHHTTRPNSLLNNLSFKLQSSTSKYIKHRTITSMAATTATKVIPAIIVGGGRVGKALEEMGTGEDLLVKRGEPVPVDFPGPILVCTRNDDLDAVLQSTPWSRWSDLVFFQNGMLEPWFESNGLGNADQVLAYFAVSKLGEPPVDGITDTNPEGLTAAYGKWASVVATRLNAGGLSCKVISLIGELASAAAAEKGIALEVGIEERLLAYARAVSHFPTAVKEFKWRNGWFYSLSEKAIAQGKEDPCPLHTKWLKELNIVQ